MGLPQRGAAEIRAAAATASASATCGLTPRSSGAPTAGHQARAGGTRYIFTGPCLASCRRRPLSSNVRPHESPTVALPRSTHTRPLMQKLTGACLCGNIRYRLIGEAVVSRICWCLDCQRISGNGTVNVIFPAASVEIEGDPSEYIKIADSGNHVRRRFCSKCGSHLFADNTGRPGLTVVRVGTLDDPSSVNPTANIWASSAPAWACLNAELEKFEQQPPQLQPPPRAA